MPSLHLLHQPCNSLTFLILSPLQTFNLPINKTIQTCSNSSTHKSPTSKLTESSLPISKFHQTLAPSSWAKRHKVLSCSENEQFDQFSATHLPESPQNAGNREIEELELLGKPTSPILVENGSVSTELDSEIRRIDKDEALEPFLRFFKAKKGSESDLGVEDEVKRVSVRYYDPKPGDFVVGVVVSGNENKLDVNIGADFLGTMLTKEMLPLYDQEVDYLLCDWGRDSEEFMRSGKIGVVKDDEAFNVERVPGRAVVEVGTVVFAQVLGRTLSGRPLLSTRRLFRRVAWHRVRQIKQLNEPIEVRITEWNTGGLITRIEGLRAFLPKAELMTRVKNFKDLKENVGRRMFVHISRIDEASNDLIISEKEGWVSSFFDLLSDCCLSLFEILEASDMGGAMSYVTPELRHLKEGTLLEGIVKKIFPYGAQVRIGDTIRRGVDVMTAGNPFALLFCSGLLHISNISRSRVPSITDLLAVDEKLKVLVVKSMFPNKISLSIAELESEPGLFLSNKEKVFAEANEMAKKYREKLPAVSITRKLEDLQNNALPFHDEAKLYSNWQWFKFENK
ncbi:hypothetical protein Syun_013729 [Stephania yunnanensis]|uniref:S1 motif domain-containing protein n=1 Tax=Stephania yunnanensis TaxID=152371 RepID=A0AAP0JI66_9MAGN